MSDLAELFARDPLNLTTDDVRAIIAKMREHQAQFELDGTKKPVAERKKSSKGAELLKDLGLT